jgi:hypothetical protein
MKQIYSFKLRCDTRFQGVFTACGCVFKEITLVGSNQSIFFEKATACSKCAPQSSFTEVDFISVNFFKRRSNEV